MFQKVPVLLRLGVIFLLLGQAWLHLFWQTPYKEFVLHGEVVEGVVTAAGNSWQEVARSPAMDKALNVYPRCAGLWFLLVGCMVILWKPSWLTLGFVFLSLLPLTLLFVALALSREPRIAIMLGNAVPLLIPLVLLLAVGSRDAVLSRLLCRVALTASFITIGLFCVGPAAFPEVYGYRLNIAQPNEWLRAVEAVAPEIDGRLIPLFVRAAGVIMMGAALAIWVSSLAAPSAWLLALAGALICSALTWANFNDQAIVESLHRWGAETIWRVPFLILPLVLVGLLGVTNKELRDASDEPRARVRRPAKRKLRRVTPPQTPPGASPPMHSLPVNPSPPRSRTTSAESGSTTVTAMAMTAKSPVMVRRIVQVQQTSAAVLSQPRPQLKTIRPRS